MHFLGRLIHCAGGGDMTGRPGWLSKEACDFIWKSILVAFLSAITSGIGYLIVLMFQIIFTIHDMPRDIAAINQTLSANHEEVAQVKRDITTMRGRVIALDAMFRAIRMPSSSDPYYMPPRPGEPVTEPWNRDNR